MSKYRFIVASVIVAMSAVSCGNGGQKGNSGSKGLYDDCLSASDAFEIASAQRYSEVPDTVFLDYYLTMPEGEVKQLTQRYLKEKKFRKDNGMFSITKDKILYDLPISENESLEMLVDFNYYDGKLSNLVLYPNDIVQFGSSDSDLYYFENYFEPVFVKKGYYAIFQGFPDPKNNKDVAAQNLKRATNGIYEPVLDISKNELTGGRSINFYRNNTIVYIISNGFGPMIMFFDAVLRKQFDDEKKAESLAQEEADRQAIDSGRSDF